jgi:uncharacterized protein (TIGR03067 family)
MDEVSSRGRAGSAWGIRSGVAITLVCGLWAVSVGDRTIAGDDPKADQAAAELSKLQGTWRATAAWTTKGTEIRQDSLKNTFLVIDGDRRITKTNGRPGPPLTIRLDPSQSPKAIDSTHNDGNHKGQVVRGIYELNGDTLKIAEGMPTRPGRPAGFEAGSGWGVGIYERVKPGR